MDAHIYKFKQEIISIHFIAIFQRLFTMKKKKFMKTMKQNKLHDGIRWKQYKQIQLTSDTIIYIKKRIIQSMYANEVVDIYKMIKLLSDDNVTPNFRDWVAQNQMKLDLQQQNINEQIPPKNIN